MTGFPTLLSPLRVGKVELRNRVVMTAASISEPWRNPLLPAEPYIEFARRRAAGGLGLLIAHPLYINPFGEYPAEIFDRHARLAAAVHTEGAPLIVQLIHFGATFRTDNDVCRPALWGFDHTQTPEGEPVHKMTDEEIMQVLNAYRRAARLVVDAGCDGAEIHGAHGYLVQQSLTPWNNSRDDEWGPTDTGDRTRFARCLIELLRTEIGPDRILGYRTPTDDLRAADDGGQGRQGLTTALQSLLDTGDIDLLNTTVGYGGPSYDRAIPNYRQPEGANIPYLRRLRETLNTTVPMIGTGRIVSPGTAEALLARGDCELVAMTRAHIAEPDLVRKLQTRQAHRIRPCVGANVCVDRKLGGSPTTSCFHNPEVLREEELRVQPSTNHKRVLVVGAGPAGLKAAEVAVRRGHRVRIVDAGKRTGGRLRAVELTAAADLASSLDYLVNELAEAHVTVELGVEVTDAMLTDLWPDHVILATGATFAPDLVGAAHMISTTAALTGDVEDDVLVYDSLGTNEAALVAEALAVRGKRVTFVTCYETVMPFGGMLHRFEAPRTWHRQLKRTITQGILGDLDHGVATIVRPDGHTITELEVGSVVAAVPLRPAIGLLPVVRALKIPHSVVGDAVAPRTAFDSFKEAHQAAMAI
ncbi:NAD(P)-binding protein [Mycobacterium talmoniae]|uniref:oxidoreductase n=1 Tax=Mycobacterium talmoniae TaxID=1858794 RepID=UPI0009F36038|nr:NAD(P)-binding protein [Mycobacterium talmoniae]